MHVLVDVKCVQRTCRILIDTLISTRVVPRVQELLKVLAVDYPGIWVEQSQDLDDSPPSYSYVCFYIGDPTRPDGEQINKPKLDKRAEVAEITELMEAFNGSHGPTFASKETREHEFDYTRVLGRITVDKWLRKVEVAAR